MALSLCALSMISGPEARLGFMFCLNSAKVQLELLKLIADILYFNRGSFLNCAVIVPQYFYSILFNNHYYSIKFYYFNQRSLFLVFRKLISDFNY